jgi:hypothetical protein
MDASMGLVESAYVWSFDARSVSVDYVRRARRLGALCVRSVSITVKPKCVKTAGENVTIVMIVFVRTAWLRSHNVTYVPLVSMNDNVCINRGCVWCK